MDTKRIEEIRKRAELEKAIEEADKLLANTDPWNPEWSDRRRAFRERAAALLAEKENNDG